MPTDTIRRLKSKMNLRDDYFMLRVDDILQVSITLVSMSHNDASEKGHCNKP